MNVLLFRMTDIGNICCYGGWGGSSSGAWIIYRATFKRIQGSNIMQALVLDFVRQWLALNSNCTFRLGFRV